MNNSLSLNKVKTSGSKYQQLKAHHSHCNRDSVPSFIDKFISRLFIIYYLQVSGLLPSCDYNNKFNKFCSEKFNVFDTKLFHCNQPHLQIHPATSKHQGLLLLFNCDQTCILLQKTVMGGTPYGTKDWMLSRANLEVTLIWQNVTKGHPVCLVGVLHTKHPVALKQMAPTKLLSPLFQNELFYALIFFF